jgi:hypothetical protein
MHFADLSRYSRDKGDWGLVIVMGHTIYWDNQDQTVIVQAYTDEPSKDDLYQLARKSAAMLDTVEYTVHLIIDERNITFMLNSNDMTFLEKLTPKNQGAVVMIVRPERLPYKTALQYLGKRFGPKAFAKPFFAESLEDARTFLREAFGVSYPTQTPLENS